MQPDAPSAEHGDRSDAVVPSGAPLGIAEDPRTEDLGVDVEVPRPGVHVVRAAGELDMLTAPTLRDALLAELADRPARLVIDLTEVSFLGSNGLAVLVETRKAADGAGVGLHLTGVSHPPVARPLELTGLVDLFDVAPLVADVLAAVDGNG